MTKILDFFSVFLIIIFFFQPNYNFYDQKRKTRKICIRIHYSCEETSQVNVSKHVLHQSNRQLTLRPTIICISGLLLEAVTV